MLEGMIMSAFALIVLFVGCRTVWEYSLRSEYRLPVGKNDNLGFGEKVTFAVGRFCEQIYRTKDFRRLRLEEEFGSYPENIAR